MTEFIDSSVTVSFSTGLAREQKCRVVAQCNAAAVRRENIYRATDRDSPIRAVVRA